jgi:putative colanic acid biosynthesis acetyltransferase WcaF
MARQIYYNAAEHIQAEAVEDPYRRPSFSLRQRIARLIWTICWIFLYRPTPRPLHFWRALLLRAFGARLGPGCRFYPASKVWAPWNLVCEDLVVVSDGSEIYNQAPIHLGSHAIVSQGAYLCASTHDFNDPAFPLLAYPMNVGAYAWICARAAVGPGVDVGEGAVLGLGSVATRELEPWGVYAGVPAVKVKERKRFGAAAAASEPR